MIVDDEILVTGSYDLSDNAEHNTINNVVVLQGDAHRAVIDQYIASFEAMWTTGQAEGLYDALLDEVQHGEGAFPIVFAPMALAWDEVNALERANREACPAVDSDAWRRDAPRYRTCAR